MVAFPCYAQTFSKLLDQALSGDPTYMGARTGVDVADAKKRQAFGALLPQVSATANTTGNKRNYQSSRDAVPEQHDSYNSNAYQLTLTQPLWRYANFVGWQQAEVIAAQAAYQFAGAEQDLFTRLGSAWFDVLAARDNVFFTRMQLEAAQRFWEIARRGEELGTHGQPQAEEARAKLDQAIADALTAETESQLKRAALEQIVGSAGLVELPFMRDYAVLADLGPEKLDVWLTRAEEQNPNILTATKAFEAASDEVRKQSAGHQPTLDVVVNYGNTAQAVGGFPGQAGYSILQGSVGLQLNVPIFSGGTQSAKTDEAIAQKEKARFDLEAARRAAILATKQAWFNWHSARAREQAGAQGVRSAKAAMDVARVGLEKGLKTEWDVLQAEQQWRAAIRDFRKGRYDQAVSYVKLKASSGSLTRSDLQAFDALFVGSEDEAFGQDSAPSAVERRPAKRPQESMNSSGAGVAATKIVVDSRDYLDGADSGPYERSSARFSESADYSTRNASSKEAISGSPAFRLDSQMKRGNSGATPGQLAKTRSSSGRERDAALVLRPVDQLAPSASGRAQQIDLRSTPAVSMGWPL